MSNDKTYAGFPWWSLPNEEEKLPKQISYQSKIKANSLQEHLLLPLMLNWVSKGMLWELAVEIAFKKSNFTAQVGDGAIEEIAFTAQVVDTFNGWSNWLVYTGCPTQTGLRSTMLPRPVTIPGRIVRVNRFGFSPNHGTKVSIIWKGSNLYCRIAIASDSENL